MAVVTAYEHSRGASVVDVSLGRDPRLSAELEKLGVESPRVPSADLVSASNGHVRLIEVKGRGSSGPIKVMERELYTFQAAGDSSWLYVVWNVTQAAPYRLVLVQDPQRLSWENIRPARKPVDSPRGVGEEGQFQCEAAEITELGVEVDLAGVALPEKAR